MRAAAAGAGRDRLALRRRLARRRVPRASAWTVETGADAGADDEAASRRRRRDRRRRSAAACRATYRSTATRPPSCAPRPRCRRRRRRWPARRARRRLGPDRRADRRRRWPRLLAAAGRDGRRSSPPTSSSAPTAQPLRRPGPGQRPPAAAPASCSASGRVLRAVEPAARRGRGPLHRRAHRGEGGGASSTAVTACPTRRCSTRSTRGRAPARAPATPWRPRTDLRGGARRPRAALALGACDRATGLMAGGSEDRYRCFGAAAARAGDGRATASCSRPTSPTTPQDGLPTEQHAAYYEARAAGGAGLIITEEHSTHPTDWPYEKLIHGFHPEVDRRATGASPRRCTATARRSSPRSTTTAARRRRCTPACRCGRRRRWPTRCSARCPRRSTTREIAEIVAGYADGRRALRRGRLRRHRAAVLAQLDRARLPVAGHQPAHRRLRRHRSRTGPGSCIEIVAAVRDAIGPDLALGVRLCGDELIEGGTTIDEAVEVARHRRGHRPGRLHQHLDRRGHRVAVHDRGVDAHPAGLRDVHPVAPSARPSTCRSSASAGSRTRCRPSGRWPRATATSSAWCGARSPTPTSRPRPGPGHTDDTRLCLSCNQECVGRMGLNRWLGLHREPAHRARGRARRRRATRRRAAGGCWWSAPGRRACRPPSPRPATGTAVTVLERDAEPGGQVRLAASVPNRAEFGDLVRNQLNECRRLGVDRRVRRRRRRATTVRAPRRRRRDRRHRVRVPARPWWAPGDGRAGSSTSATCSTGARRPTGRRGRDRRDRLPPGHLGRRAARRPRLRGRGHHARAWSSGQDLGHHPRHGELVDPGHRQGHRADHRAGADVGVERRHRSTSSTTRPAR